MADVEKIEDRDALYYPFIHLRNEAWLRNILLFFPHVLRMTPPGFELNDSSFVRRLARTEGRRGEMLVGSYPLNSPIVHEAAMRLARRLEADVGDAAFREKYGRAATAARYSNDSVFQIHRDKFAEPLQQLLGGTGLVWNPSRPNRGDWFALHPVIGEIIMSTAAVAAARDKGCDVLTDTERDHRVAATRDEDVIYSTLLGRGEGTESERRPTSHEIGELVVATTFDLTGMAAEDFAALSREREALFDFRRLLAERAAEIPTTADHKARCDRAKEAAEQIVAEWESKRRTWGRFLKRAFRLEAAEEAKEGATELLKVFFPSVAGAGVGAAVTAAATTGAAAGGALLGAAPGLAVGFIYYGAKVWRDLGVEEREAPTRFLSRVAKRGGTLAAACTPAPQG